MSRISEFLISNMAGAALDTTSKERLILVAALVAASEHPTAEKLFSSDFRATEPGDGIGSATDQAPVMELQDALRHAIEDRDREAAAVQALADALAAAGFPNESPQEKNPATGVVEPLDPRPWPERAASFITNLARRAEPGPVDNRFSELLALLHGLGVDMVTPPGEPAYAAVKLDIASADLTPLEQVRQRLHSAEARAQEPRISRETLDRLTAAATGWRMPKRGDKVRILDAVPDAPWMVAGNIYEVFAAACWYPVLPAEAYSNDPFFTTKSGEFAVIFEGKPFNAVVPLRLLEPVTDAAPGPDDDRHQNGE